MGDILQPTHLLFVLVVALLVLGPKRLPEVGRALGRGLRDFRSAMSGEDPPEQVNSRAHEPEPMVAPEPQEYPDVVPHPSQPESSAPDDGPTANDAAPSNPLTTDDTAPLTPPTPDDTASSTPPRSDAPPADEPSEAVTTVSGPAAGS